jgi:hypothetical protein
MVRPVEQIWSTPIARWRLSCPLCPSMTRGAHGYQRLAEHFWRSSLAGAGSTLGVAYTFRLTLAAVAGSAGRP